MSSSLSPCSQASIRACWSLASPNHLKPLSFDLLMTACIEHEGASLHTAIWPLCCAQRSHIAICDFPAYMLLCMRESFALCSPLCGLPDKGFPDEEDAISIWMIWVAMQRSLIPFSCLLQCRKLDPLACYTTNSHPISPHSIAPANWHVTGHAHQQVTASHAFTVTLQCKWHAIPELPLHIWPNYHVTRLQLHAYPWHMNHTAIRHKTRELLLPPDLVLLSVTPQDPTCWFHVYCVLNFVPNLSSLLHWLPLCLTVFVVFDHVMTINAESLTCCTGCCSIDLFVLTQLLTKTQYFQLCWCFSTLQMWPFRAKVSPHTMVSLT